MFDNDFYIDYIKQYLPSTNNTVSWITANWEDIVIDGDSFERTDPIELPDAADTFSLNNIFKNFKIDNSIFPISSMTDNPVSFSTNGIFAPFFITTEYPTPVQGFKNVDYQNIFSLYEIENGYPYIREASNVNALDYNKIFSYFKIKTDSYPYPVSNVEPFNLDNVYCIFKTDSQEFHGYPTPKLKKWVEKIPDDTFKITPDLIDTNLKIQGQEEIEIEDKKDTIYTQIVSPAIKDRDIYRDEYHAYIEKYWENKEEV